MTFAPESPLKSSIEALNSPLFGVFLAVRVASCFFTFLCCARDLRCAERWIGSLMSPALQQRATGSSPPGVAITVATANC